MRTVMGAALLALAGCSGTDTGEGDRVDDILALSCDVAAGETSYTTNCVACHGVDGTGDGASFPDITGATDEATVIQQVLEGGEGMTPYDSLPDQEIADLVAYVLTL